MANADYGMRCNFIEKAGSIKKNEYLGVHTLFSKNSKNNKSSATSKIIFEQNSATPHTAAVTSKFLWDSQVFPDQLALSIFHILNIHKLQIAQFLYSLLTFPGIKWGNWFESVNVL